jgi:hypothetical protein
MTKRFLLPGYLILFVSFTLYAGKAFPQATPTKPAPVKPATTTPTTAAQKAKDLRMQVDPAQMNDKTLAGQYQYLLTKSYHYQEPILGAFWKNFRDTLGVERRKVKELQAKLSAQTQTVSSLKADVTTKEQSLSETNAKVDNISVFGMMLPKSTYNLVMFGSVAGLALALIIVIATTAKYKHEARHRIELYEEIDEEYKSFKAKANEKEKKLARELQTERNKLDELLGRG